MDDPSLGDELNRHLTKVETKVTGRRYCTNCASLRTAEGGEQSRYRWMCKFCVERRNTRTISKTI